MTSLNRLANMLDTEGISKKECYEYLMKHIKEIQQVKEKLDKMTDKQEHHNLCYQTIVNLLRKNP